MPASPPLSPSPSISESAPRLPLQLALRDGRAVVVRKIREDDKSGVLDAFGLLSPDSRYTRFMAAMKDLPLDLLDAVVHPVPGHDCTLVAEAANGDLVGGARFTAIPTTPTATGNTCEFAVTVLDGWHGTGLARQLMQLLTGFARAAGFHTMEGYVLASNSSMRGLAHRLGFRDTVSRDDPTLRVVTLDLRAAPAA